MKALRKQNVDVSVLTTNLNGQGKIPATKDFVDFEGVPVCYCKAYHLKVLPYYSKVLNEKLKNIVSKYDIVLLDSNWTAYGIFSGDICRKARVPYLIYSHGCLSPRGIAHGYVRKQIWWRLFDKKLYESSQGIIAITNAEIDHLRALGIGNEIYVIPNGVDDINFDSLKAESTVREYFPEICNNEYFLFLGRVSRLKGVEDLIMAYYQLSKSTFEDNSPMLVIAGPGNNKYLLQLQRLTEELGINERVIFTGVVHGYKKNSLIASSKCLINPSKSDVLSLVALEAMSIGTPIIITKQCNFDDVSTLNAGIVVDASVKELTNAMKWSIQNYAEHKEMSRRAKKLVKEKYSWGRVSIKTIEVCEKIIKSYRR